ncbi:MAG TPA: TonB-dependent siderophore receptor [Bryobacteraceae bacterium]|nr:TonB-dependent siderophore receptor [Bryobacteraceae bacterium]
MKKANKAASKKAGRKESRGRWTWPVAYHWAAMGTLVVYTAIGSKAVAPAYAQAAHGVSAASGVPASLQGDLPVYRFEIPAGPLASVMASFQRQTGLKLNASEEGIGDIPSPGVTGVLTADLALQKLLEGTGIAYRYTTPASVVLEIRGPATTIEVSTDASLIGFSTPKYAAPLRDTPQSVSEIPSQVLADQGVTTLRDALRNVAGLSLAAGEGGAQGDNLTIRGFSARNDLFIDGMRDFGSYYRDPFNIEEIEVLQGPSSVTFGRGSTGGVVNQAYKVPHAGRAFSGSLDLGSDLTRRGVLDLNVPVPALGSGSSFRLNLMGHQSKTAGRDIAENRRFGIAPSLVLGLGTATRWTFSYLHQGADDTPDYGIPWLFNGPAPVNRRNYYGFRDGNYLRTVDDIGTARVEHEVSNRVSLRNQVRYANYVRDARITEAQIPATVKPGAALAAISVNRNQITVDSVESYFDDQLDVTAQFETGFLRHSLVTGVEAGRETSDPTRFRYTGVPTTNLLNPDPDQTFAGIAATTSQADATAVSAAGYVLDTVKLGRKWALTGGLRWDYLNTDYKQAVAPAAAFHRIDRVATWRAAAVYKPVQAGSIYFAAGTSFNPSAETLALSSGNANLPPEKNRSLEFGTKWDVAGGRLSLRTALFRTEKTNAREPDPNDPLLNVLAGEQRVTGWQVEARGHLTARWDILSSYAYLDAKVTGSNYYPQAIGARLANVPANTFNLWTRHDLPWRWDVGVGGNYVSDRTASSTAPFDPATGLVKQAPGYWLFGFMARRSLTEHVDLQANVNNLANRYYYDQLHPGHIVPGAGRSALIGLKFKF